MQNQTNCPNCGAPYKHGQDHCLYCETPYPHTEKREPKPCQLVTSKPEANIYVRQTVVEEWQFVGAGYPYDYPYEDENEKIPVSAYGDKKMTFISGVNRPEKNTVALLYDYYVWKMLSDLDGKVCQFAFDIGGERKEIIGTPDVYIKSLPLSPNKIIIVKITESVPAVHPFTAFEYCGLFADTDRAHKQNKEGAAQDEAMKQSLKRKKNVTKKQTAEDKLSKQIALLGKITNVLLNVLCVSMVPVIAFFVIGPLVWYFFELCGIGGAVVEPLTERCGRYVGWAMWIATVSFVLWNLFGIAYWLKLDERDEREKREARVHDQYL